MYVKLQAIIRHLRWRFNQRIYFERLNEEHLGETL